MFLAKFAIKNPYLTFVVMFALSILGIFALKNIPVTLNPDISLPTVSITTAYDGASPNIIETDVTAPLEEDLRSLNGIKHITSTSAAGVSTISVAFNADINPETALQSVRDRIPTAKSKFPKDVDDPIVNGSSTMSAPALYIEFSSNKLSLEELSQWIEVVAKPELSSIIGIENLSLSGEVKRQIYIDIIPNQLNNYKISLEQVNSAIVNNNINYPAGFIYNEGKDININLNGKLTNLEQFANIIITYRNNTPVLVSDIAKVNNNNKSEHNHVFFNGKPAVELAVYVAKTANWLKINDDINQSIIKLNQIKPQETDIVTAYNEIDNVKDSVNSVYESILYGILFTIVVILLFLNSWRSTIITGLTLPITLLATIFIIYIMSFTINFITLMAMSLIIGLLIDDAIVVRGNIVKHLHNGESCYNASIKGTREIAPAVLATTLCLVAIFLPIAFMHGLMGKYFYQFGIIITIAVIISLIVSFTLDPTLSSIWREPVKNSAKNSITKIFTYFEFMIDYLKSLLVKLLSIALGRKKTFLSITILMLIASFALATKIGGQFEPDVDYTGFGINIKTVTGADASYSTQKLNEITHLLKKNIPEISDSFGYINSGSDKIFIRVVIGEKITRHRTAQQIMQQTRELLNNFAGISVLSVGGGSSPINITIKGYNIYQLRAISQDIMAQITKIKGITDLSSSFTSGDPSFNFNLDRTKAASLGIDLANVGNTLNTYFAGNIVTRFYDPTTSQTSENYTNFVKHINSNIC